jgi:hypothetical protein
MDVEEALMHRNIAVVGMVLLSVAAVAQAGLVATPIAVGSGSETASVLINFSDDHKYWFEVSYDGSVTGIGLFDAIEAETSLTTQRVLYGDDVFIDGISYDGHSNAGYGGGEDWWHYWVRSSGAGDWQAPAYGASDRTAGDGTWDGWVYGRAGAPYVPEPASLALLCAAAVAGLARLRRTHHRHARG